MQAVPPGCHREPFRRFRGVSRLGDIVTLGLFTMRVSIAFARGIEFASGELGL